MSGTLVITAPPGTIPVTAMITSIYWFDRLADAHTAFLLMMNKDRLNRLCPVEGAVSVHFPGTSVPTSHKSQGTTLFTTQHPVLRRSKDGHWTMSSSQTAADGDLVCLLR